MQKIPFSGSEKVSANEFDTEHFLQAYVYGMEKTILSRVNVKAPVSEYCYWADPVSEQFNRAYQNFTWFLSGHGFMNVDNIDACKRICDLLTLTDTEVCLSEWNMSGADLRCAILSRADMFGVNLSGANLERADFEDAILIFSNLRNAKLSGANLIGAVLVNADLTSADLTHSCLIDSDLSGANLNDAILNRARYCKEDGFETVFPDGFDPEKHGMTEVDQNGIPVMR